MRPSTVSYGVAGYQATPDFAFQGWRLRIPGGPEGGQYHGFIAPDSSGWPSGVDELSPGPAAAPAGGGWWAHDSALPWQHDWGGLIMREGETLSDYVYRSPGEMRPRANASGGANVIRGYQAQRAPGFAEAPGNYRGVGFVPAFTRGAGRSNVVSYPSVSRYVVPPVSGGGVVAIPGGSPFREPVCPAWGCNGPQHPVVVQPAPPVTPTPSPTVPVTTLPPTSPAPAPTVSVNDPQCLALGMNGGPYPYCNAGGLGPIDAMAPAGSAAALPATTPDLSDWLNESTLIPNVPNMYVAIGGALAAYLLMRRKK